MIVHLPSELPNIVPRNTEINLPSAKSICITPQLYLSQSGAILWWEPVCQWMERSYALFACANVPLLQIVKFLSAFEMEVGSLPTTNSHYPLLGQLFHLGNSLSILV